MKTLRFNEWQNLAMHVEGEAGVSPAGHLLSHQWTEERRQVNGKPDALHLANGCELTSHTFVAWARDGDMGPCFIEPDKADQNARLEHFNRTYRDTLLIAYLFESIEQVQQTADECLVECNELRPHDSLARVLPLTYKPRELLVGEYSFKLLT